MKQNRTITLLAFGDSLFAGFGLANPADALPSVLQRMLAEDGYDVRMVNAGVSGDTTSGGLARLDWSLQENPDAALLELGANDGLMGLPTRAMESNLDAMLTRLADRDVPTLLVGMRAIANYGAGYAREFDAVFPRLAERHGVPLYPFLLEGVVQRSELNQADGVHPNAAGVREIAARIYPMVRDLVETVLTR
ncbi:arylesterase [Desulfocurvus sp. DL9XJH121]